MSRNRREFLKQAGALSAALACCGSASLLAGCSSFRYAAYTERGSDLVIKKTEFEKDRFVLVPYFSLPTPIYLSKLAEDEYSALLLVCSHKQCEVRPGTEVLACPCHGSEYSNTGEVLKGPAEKALTSFPVTADEQNIYIQIEQKLGKK